jgi:hypothetical protein
MKPKPRQHKTRAGGGNRFCHRCHTYGAEVSVSPYPDARPQYCCTACGMIWTCGRQATGDTTSEVNNNE